MMVASKLYKIVGYAENARGNDLEVHVEASKPREALKQAIKLHPKLKKMGDVRVYVRSDQWVGCRV